MRKPADASPEDVLIALHLWPRLSDDIRDACALLPRGCPPPPRAAFTTGAEPAAIAPAAGGVFARAYLEQLSPALLEATHSHPRMHSLWTHVLALLLPGFTVTRSAAAAADADGAEGAAASGSAAANGSAPEPAAGKKRHGKEGKGGKDGAAAADKPAAAGEGKGGRGGAGGGAKGAPNAGHLAALWDVVVEGGLMSSTHERKFLAMNLFMVRAQPLHCSLSRPVIGLKHGYDGFQLSWFAVCLTAWIGGRGSPCTSFTAISTSRWFLQRHFACVLYI